MSVAPPDPEFRSVRIPVSSIALYGDLGHPVTAAGVVVFAHGSGSSRFSTRNRYVAQVLHHAGFATLLMDLLTPEEEAIDLRTRHLRFDIPLLAQRVVGALDWVEAQQDTAGLRLGLFGASTGAAAALIAAARRPDRVGAVVSRGGRPDLARRTLRGVRAPTLLIVGGDDAPVLELNRLALAELTSRKRLAVVPGATHLFEEVGALEQVAELAADWFHTHLDAGRPAPE